MKSKVFISIFIGILILLLLPFLIWQISPQKNLDVLIIDKTVPDDSFREHKGIVWALKYNKYVKNNNKEYDLKTDYAGCSFYFFNDSEKNEFCMKNHLTLNDDSFWRIQKTGYFLSLKFCCKSFPLLYGISLVDSQCKFFQK